MIVNGIESEHKTRIKKNTRIYLKETEYSSYMIKTETEKKN